MQCLNVICLYASIPTCQKYTRFHQRWKPVPTFLHPFANSNPLIKLQAVAPGVATSLRSLGKSQKVVTVKRAQ